MMKIAVIGAGPAGATLATLLSRKGFNVNVFEKVSEPGPVGAGIMLQRTGMHVLNELGVYDHIKNNGATIDKFHGFNKKGRRVLSVDFAASNTYGLGVQRGTLFQSIFHALSKTDAVVYTGKEIVEVSGNVGSKVIKSSDGEEFGPFDAVVVANGSRSKLRDGRGITRVSKPQRWGAVWSLIDSTDERYNHSIIQKYDKTTRMLGFMPVGTLNDPASDKFKINFFWSVRMSDADMWKQRSLEDWRSEMLQLAPEHEEILSQIEDKDKFTLAPYFDVFLSPMYEEGTFFVGDAAHALSPQLSAGTNLAILDSWLLSEALSSHNDISIVAQEFYKSRNKQLKYYYKLSRLVTPMFQSDYKVAWIRNNILGPVIKVPGPRGIFTDTIMGIRKGIFSKIDKSWYM